MKYALLQINVENYPKKIVLVEYKHYDKYQRMQQDNYYTLVGTLESDLKSNDLLKGFSADAENRATYYKNQLQEISQFIKL